MLWQILLVTLVPILMVAYAPEEWVCRSPFLFIMHFFFVGLIFLQDPISFLAISIWSAFFTLTLLKNHRFSLQVQEDDLLELLKVMSAFLFLLRIL